VHASLDELSPGGIRRQAGVDPVPTAPTRTPEPYGRSDRGGPTGDGDRIEHEDLPAGEFSAWLHGMQRALRSERGSEVPCGGCTACCTSSPFVHIGPDEVETLARIPSELLFPAPRMPVGHVLLGYDDHGRCPMLTDDRCSIYENRPRTCRTYDCRVFPATGLRSRKTTRH
jgi:hypothetical protein